MEALTLAFAPALRHYCLPTYIPLLCCLCSLHLPRTSAPHAPITHRGDALPPLWAWRAPVRGGGAAGRAASREAEEKVCFERRCWTCGGCYGSLLGTAGWWNAAAVASGSRSACCDILLRSLASLHTGWAGGREAAMRANAFL